MDTKATIDVGEYSRYGRSRCLEPVKALDHDMQPKEKLVPGGILEPVSGLMIKHASVYWVHYPQQVKSFRL